MQYFLTFKTYLFIYHFYLTWSEWYRNFKYICLLQVQRLEDRYGRCEKVDVFIHLTRGGVQELVDTGYVVTHAGAADTDPRVVILPHNGKKEDFARMKECTAQLIEKLFLRRG